MNWLKRFFASGKKEVKEGGNRGKVSVVKYGFKGLMAEPYTSYDITGDDGNIYRAAMLGHQNSIQKGQNIEFELGTETIVFYRKQVQKEREGGFVDIVPEETVWKSFKSYKILEEQESVKSEGD